MAQKRRFMQPRRILLCVFVWYDSFRSGICINLTNQQNNCAISLDAKAKKEYNKHRDFIKEGLTLTNILFAASECVPFVKTGGLADVCSALPKALDKQGLNVSIVTP